LKTPKYPVEEISQPDGNVLGGRSARNSRIAGLFAARRTTRRKTEMTAKRELINTGTDKRYIRRNKKGQFKESVDVGRSLAADRRKKAKTVVKSGQGDRGDQER
jgi:hypothetical protein